MKRNRKDIEGGILAELDRLAEAVGQEQELSYGELAWLQDHEADVLAYGDIWLAEWAGIPEEKYQEYWG